MSAAIAICANGYDQLLVEVNGLRQNNFGQWLFHPGMLFDAPQKWWGDLGARDFPHEGVDFCLYRSSSGKIQRLGEKSRIPVMHDGVVRAIFKDYLGWAVVVEHQGDNWLSVYAHTEPIPGLEPGVVVRKGDIIAHVAGSQRSKSNILAHLHLSLARPAPDLVYTSFVWNVMRDRECITLLDPIVAIAGPYEVVDPDGVGAFGL